MSFSEIFIRRPVLSTVVSFLILLLGAQGILSMSIRQYPKVDETVVTVTTAYPGASADVIQGFITSTITKSVSSAEGVDYVTSKSALGLSTVSVFMRLNTDPDKALTEIIAKVQQVRGQLPTEAKDPVIQKGTGFQFALMYLAARSETMNAQELTDYLIRVIQPRFATVNGVANADILGAQEFAMRVWIDPVALASRNVTATEVLAAINSSNFLSAPGKTKNEYYAYSIEAKTTLQDPETFGALPLRNNGAEIVRLRDVAHIELAAASTDTAVRFNGKEGVFLGIFQTPSANPLDVAAGVRAELPLIQNSLPSGMTIELVYDSTEAISASIDEVLHTILEASAIVVVVIFLFLGSFRSVVIPIVTIPLSLIGVCFILWALGYSLNTLTLLAMVLAIGLVVDDAIVVVENIHRHIEEGLKPMRAAIVGMQEITGAVITMTITLAAVYAPIAFTQGVTGALFREFSLTLAGAVVLSGFVALTVSPMMSARILKPGGGRIQHFIDRVFDRFGNWYARRLTGSLKVRPITLLMVLALLGTMVFLFTKTSSELAPEEDQGAMFAVVNAPQYATIDYTQLYIDEIAAKTMDIPEREALFSIAGSGAANSGFAGLVLKPWSQRTRSQAQVQQEVQGRLDKVAGVQAFVFGVPSLPGTGGGLPIQVVIQSTEAADRVYAVADEIKNRAMASGKFIIIQNSLSFDTPKVNVLIDRNRAAALGVSVADIGNTLTLLVGENGVSKFDREARAYDIIPQVPQKYRMNPESLGTFFVRSQSGAMVPLSAVVSVSTTGSAPAIEQFNQLNSATLSALPRPTVTSGEGLATLQQIAKEVMPRGYFLEYAGQSRTEIETGNTLLIVFGLAIVVIYLVLAAQFESFRDPLIIMMSVPLSIFGALVPLNLGLASLNIYSQVGLITLVGLITKHGILMVEFANQQRELRGLNRHDAIVEAARVRLRPILMTTAAMVFGVLPLLFAEGAGAKARFSMGLVIAMGMSIGTIFTLFVVPMFYTYLSSPHHKKEEDEGAPAAATPPDAVPAH
ncbi:efflux RND transporter permease subunit [Kaistia dalseonensis]|uniref:Multidrug efflux pump n=1 Tax=Kaistia dalseonensis TaxID=410840 RepID=A0ABU0HB29_9HYPH|nr:efflux RND transporter permease subunit [Kaistia dalseonensis]MCX5496897.1 efflux RND transporter permease subunit [Kaistia dalseonensis]MDQ0439523.1 multidrug efflux pump [Kaistia dalseonensis]